jgi:hypothetical protein
MELPKTRNMLLFTLMSLPLFVAAVCTSIPEPVKLPDMALSLPPPPPPVQVIEPRPVTRQMIQRIKETNLNKLQCTLSTTLVLERDRALSMESFEKNGTGYMTDKYQKEQVIIEDSVQGIFSAEKSANGGFLLIALFENDDRRKLYFEEDPNDGLFYLSADDKNNLQYGSGGPYHLLPYEPAERPHLLVRIDYRNLQETPKVHRAKGRSISE